MHDCLYVRPLTSPCEYAVYDTAYFEQFHIYYKIGSRHISEAGDLDVLQRHNAENNLI